MRISDWSSDVCSSDLAGKAREAGDRPLVVDDVEDDRRIIDGREGQRRVEIALGRRAFAAPDGRDSAVALRGRGHRPAPADAGPGARGVRPGSGYRPRHHAAGPVARSEEHTSELQSLMRISYAVFCLKKKTTMPKTQVSIYTNKLH